MAWELPEHAAFLRAIGAFARVIVLDRRGTGLSDAVPDIPTIEERMDDVRAVMDDAGVDRAAVLGMSEGGPMAIVFAAAFPERCSALMLFGTFARIGWNENYPCGVPMEESEKFLHVIDTYWGQGRLVDVFVPSRAGDAAFRKQWARFEHNSMGRGTAARLMSLNFQTDVRGVLSSIRVPTIVLHRIGDQPVPIALGRYIHENIEGSKFIELPGDDHFFATGDVDSLTAEIE